MKFLIQPRLLKASILSLLCLASCSLHAQTFRGTNAPGRGTNFSFSVATGTTNLALTVAANDTAFSHLLMKKGSAPTDASYDWIAQLDGADNTIALQQPELTAGNYHFRVRTPANSATHEFVATLEKNVPDLRSGARPAMKPMSATNSGALAPGDWQYFRIEMPADSPGWRLVLSATGDGDPDLYVQRGDLPTEWTALKSSYGAAVDTIFFSDAEAEPGAYFVGVHLPDSAGGGATFTLYQEPGYVRALAWDSGTAHYGVQVYTNSNPNGGTHYFKIVPQNAAVGAWRTALNVTGGEADLYLARGPFFDNIHAYSYQSTREGSDGLVLHHSEFAAAEDWFIAVNATPGAQWTLVSGAPYVQDLGPLAAGASSGSGPVTIGAEGIRYFKTTIPVDTLAWRLWLDGAGLPILVQKSAVPVWRDGWGYTDLEQGEQMLVVPPYLDSAFGGTYFVGVAGAPGATITLDSRKHSVSDITFNATNGPAVVTGFGYTTYRVQVPVQQIAWQVDAVPVAGDPQVAVRREEVPNEWHNDALSAVSGSVIDSLTLVPPTLSDGTFYITVFGSGGHSFRLRNSNPLITPIRYVSTNTNPELNRVGWRFFAVTDINEQLGSLGWYLHLDDAPAGTRIAIRRNAVPSLWNYRNAEGYGYATGGHYDELGGDFLQQPGHPADIWYVGVYNPDLPLDNFRLITEHLTARALPFAGGRASNAHLTAPRVDYYAVSIVSNTPSWKLKLTVSDGEAHLAVLKDELPRHTTANWTWPLSPPGQRIEKAGDEHYVLLPATGETLLTPGTYYLGVSADSAAPAGYVLESLGAMAITSLPTFTGSDLTYDDFVAGGETKAYRFAVSPAVPAFVLMLEPRVGNPVMALAAGTNLPFAANLVGPLGDYGSSGGAGTSWEEPVLITVPNPEPGIYSLIVKGAADENGDHPNASYSIHLRQPPIPPLAFDGGRNDVTDHPPDGWRFFSVTAPTSAFGWDLRVANVTSGNPRLIVRREWLPDPDAPGLDPRNDQWPSGYQWWAADDWTGFSLNPDGSSRWGTALAMGVGHPLETGPFSYFVAVWNPGDTPASYTLLSRGIGTNFMIPVQGLAFTNGLAVANHQPAGEAAYYRVEIPENAPSWKLKLAAVSGESLMVVQKDVLPNISATDQAAVSDRSGGKLMRKDGAEHFVLLPEPHEDRLQAGTYYLAVISAGQNPIWGTLGTGGADFELRSLGSLSVVDLGSVSGLDLTYGDTLAGGETKAYQFTAGSAVSSVEVRLENRSGRPAMALRSGRDLPAAAAASTILGVYGADGGRWPEWVEEEIITVANPAAGVFSLIVKALPLDESWPEASYTIRIHATGATPLAFDGTPLTVADHEPGTWRYFRVEVPTNALGWDLRLLNVDGAFPQLGVARDRLPDGSAISPFLGSTWPSGAEWDADWDWTSYSTWPDGSSRWGQVLAMGMGNPLEPGRYFVGVRNSGDTAANYTIASRGIGAGFSIPVESLAFSNGVVNRAGLVAGEAAYYRIDVPPHVPGWKVKLTPTSGEAMIVVQQGALPSVDCSGWASVTTRSGGKSMQRSGNDHLLLLPEWSRSNLMAGSYYVAVVSEGVNPGYMIGQGSTDFELVSLGSPAVTELGTISGSDLIRSDTLEGGEVRAYRFTVPAGTPSVEVRLENRVAHPLMAVRSGPELAATSYGWFSTYGTDGGQGYDWASDNVITLPDPAPGVFTVMVKAESFGDGHPDASYTLRVGRQQVPPLNFSEIQNTNGLSNAASGSLADGQSIFYQVEVPEILAGIPVMGWRLGLAQLQGNPQVRVRKGALPADNTDATGFVPDMAVIVPELLASGTWYVEVRSYGYSEFTLTSRTLELERPPWIMPPAGQSATTPGVAAPFFADTGVSTNGTPLPDDQGIDLAQGDFHYYAVLVPTNNGALLRAQLDGISGNPDLYVRAGKAPTLSHGWYGLYDRSLTRTGTEYANWVPLDGRSQTALEPGLWYIAVHAAGNSNARYRLRLSTGDIQYLALNGGVFTSQTLAASDWRYYRVEIPEDAPANWLVTFSQEAGDVLMHVRDTIPPGTASETLWDRDWGTDQKEPGDHPQFDTPGTCTLTTPPLRPGGTYYLGFKAITDAIFSVSSATAGGNLAVNGTIAFYGGHVTNQLPTHASAVFRVRVPADGVQWLSRARHSEEVLLYISQGTLPQPPETAYASGGWADTTLNQPLRPESWPWQPDRIYYLLVTNTSGVTQPFSFTLDGRNGATLDEDNDGLPDAWELSYWPYIFLGIAEADPDNDGLTNIDEFHRQTNPLVPDLPQLMAQPLAGTGTFKFIFTGPTNRPYRIQASSTLNYDWTDLTNFIHAGLSRLIQDGAAATNAHRFYRAVSP